MRTLRGGMTMATFILIHGAWHGGWCWWKVAPRLRNAGHTVLAPSLTGLGDRQHLAPLLPPGLLNLDLHIRDIARLLESRDARNAILVAHAYAGMVATGVAAVCPQRLAALVYVNGVIPADGAAMVDQLQAVRGPEFVAGIRRRIDAGEPFLPAPTTADEIARRWAITDPDDQAFVLPRLSPQPTQTFAQPVRLNHPDSDAAADAPTVADAAPLRREFILCRQSGFDAVADQAAAHGWGIHHLYTGHDPMITAPAELTDILLQIAPR